MRKPIAGLVASVTILALLPAVAGAADITVTSNLDNGTGCTLREAIASANTGSATGCANGAGTGTDRIIFDPVQFPREGVVETINLTGVEPSISSDLNIEGYGMNELTVDGDAGNGRVFRITSGTVGISGLKASGGRPAAEGFGGGIYSFSTGSLNLDDVCVCGNLLTQSSASSGTNAIVNGGGIQATAAASITIANSVIDNNDITASQSAGTGSDFAAASAAGANLSAGTVTITNTTISNNDATAAKTGSTGTAEANGAGVQVSGAPTTLTIDRSTFDNNHASATATGGTSATGGALRISGAGTSTLLLSTLADNRTDAAQPLGGAVYHFSDTNPLSIISSTIARNGTTAASPAVDGKNLAIQFGTGNTIVNSIVSDPAGGGGNCEISGGTFTSQGYSDDYTPTVGGVGSCGFGAGTNSTANPLLDPAGLAANGGTTETIALQAGSPMIDAGSNAAQTTPGIDQRGLSRPSDFLTIPNAANATDIGAFEVQSPDQPPANPPVAGPTGQQAAALRKCKKKRRKLDWSKKRYNKCKRAALTLPL